MSEFASPTLGQRRVVKKRFACTPRVDKSSTLLELHS